MSTIVCYEPETEEREEQARAVWRRITDPEHLTQCEDTLMLRLPEGEGCRGFVNGLEVLGGFQVVEPGDLVRVVEADGSERSYVVGHGLPTVEPGDGRICQFTGKPIRGQAIECPSCGRLFALEVAEQLGQCPLCRAPLSGEEETPPEKELQ
jgi:hypothetical protein